MIVSLLKNKNVRTLLFVHFSAYIQLFDLVRNLGDENEKSIFVSLLKEMLQLSVVCLTTPCMNFFESIITVRKQTGLQKIRHANTDASKKFRCIFKVVNFLEEN